MNHLATAPAASLETTKANCPLGIPDIVPHLPLVSALAAQVARRHRIDLCSLNVDDLVAIGAEALLKAASRFDPSRGATFATFAHYRIQGAMLDAIRAGGCFPRGRSARADDTLLTLTLSLDGSEFLQRSLPDTADLPDEAADARRTAQRLHAAVAQLPALERRLVEGYYFESLTLDDLGAETGKSRSWVCRLLQRAIRSLRASRMVVELKRPTS